MIRRGGGNGVLAGERRLAYAVMLQAARDIQWLEGEGAWRQIRGETQFTYDGRCARQREIYRSAKEFLESKGTLWHDLIEADDGSPVRDITLRMGG